MNTLCIVLITLVVYSLLSTIIYIILNENEDILMAFGLGVFGLLLLAIVNTIRKIKKVFKYYINKRSIFIEISTGNKYKCRVKDTKDLEWLSKYKLIKRYANKSEWKTIPDFNIEIINDSKKNCDNCVYNEECSRSSVYVKCTNEYGTVIEFNKFKAK